MEPKNEGLVQMMSLIKTGENLRFQPFIFQGVPPCSSHPTPRLLNTSTFTPTSDTIADGIFLIGSIEICDVTSGSVEIIGILISWLIIIPIKLSRTSSPIYPKQPGVFHCASSAHLPSSTLQPLYTANNQGNQEQLTWFGPDSEIWGEGVAT